MTCINVTIPFHQKQISTPQLTICFIKSSLQAERHVAWFWIRGAKRCKKHQKACPRFASWKSPSQVTCGLKGLGANWSELLSSSKCLSSGFFPHSHKFGAPSNWEFSIATLPQHIQFATSPSGGVGGKPESSVIAGDLAFASVEGVDKATFQGLMQRVLAHQSSYTVLQVVIGHLLEIRCGTAPTHKKLSPFLPTPLCQYSGHVPQLYFEEHSWPSSYEHLFLLHFP